ncbi:MAG: precorrin-3B C17-methyltransferase / cobalt-factor methyltransferase [Methanobacterium sp.]|jgi:precorrin-3B C17-methyltransferase|uniref:precorrin-3B C(17)-methyltransferase n=1 Tax=Methanobacterium sp. TaxID=2164 RepID=UPI0003C9D54C|nr:precorrin-3B C(17)-methyltransferase [Methanobacterium sp.]MDI3550779.1 precorrin-3B C17-methyltransferase / cobalt-factor methyltransferase [Methanobacterium sp.]CDG66098.1 putative cobalt-precorrin-3B C(17)-methyltransferase [Methanobacterium sp. MB1]
MIRIIGIGPRREDMTLRALKALEKSDVVIGYGGYTRQIKDLLEGKKIISKGMGQEVDRAELAIDYSKKGYEVAVISSGDPGVYGMANVIHQIQEKYSDVEVEVIPGVTAVNYSAALLGAPLHDFAVISLSDILTPLSEIKRKVRAAAAADFIIAFYNPRSKRRTKPLNEALKILRKIRNPQTPVGIIKTSDIGSEVRIVSLGELDEEEVDMNTTLLVGNTFTYVDDGKMVTPRGYVIPHHTHPLAEEFYQNYLAGEGNKGPNSGCEYYPCHQHPQNCTFCYCPFYPCGDPSTGGHWIKEKKVWSCEQCTWIHQDDTVRYIEGKLPSIIEKVEDLEDKKKELLKLRRECIYHTK